MAIEDIYRAVISFRLKEVDDLVQAEIDAGTDVDSILQDGLIAPMDEVGDRFAQGEFFVPEMLRAAKTMKSGLEVLRPFLADDKSKKNGTVIIGTVKGDLHDIGKNLVSMMMEGAGFNVVNLGVDIDSGAFVSKAKELRADFIALSALLTTTMPAMRETVDAVRKAGLNTKVVVGGAPVTEKFAVKIGADGFGEDAAKAVEIARRLVGK